MAGLNWLINALRNAVFGREGSDGGMTVDRALSYPPVWYAVSKISGHVAQLPCNLHREMTKRGKLVNEKPTDHIGYRLMRVKPNNYQTPFVFKRQLMVHALMVGNGYAFYKRGNLMDTELLPLMPDRMEPRMVFGEKVFFYKPDRDERLALSVDIDRGMKESMHNGTMEVIAIDDRDIFHLPGLSYDGISGKSLLTLAAQSWNLGLGAESQERGRQKRGYSGGLTLEAPVEAFSRQKDAEEFLEWFRKEHDGADNAGKTALLTRGIKANAIVMSNADAQFLEQRRFQRQEVALTFLLEQILGDDTSVSYSSGEQKNLAYLANCLGSWLTTYEQESEAKLLTESEQQRGYYFKFNDGALLRTDKQTTSVIISTLRSSGVISANEARGWLDMNPVDGGDVYANPAINPSGAAAPQEKLIENRLKHLLTVEGKQAIAACSASNFVAKIEGLYVKWERTWRKNLGTELGAEHCRESKAILLDCAGVATNTEDLRTKVTEAVAAWPKRARELIKRMGVVKC